MLSVNKTAGLNLYKSPEMLFMVGPWGIDCGWTEISEIPMIGHCGLRDIVSILFGTTALIDKVGMQYPAASYANMPK